MSAFWLLKFRFICCLILILGLSVFISCQDEDEKASSSDPENSNDDDDDNDDNDDNNDDNNDNDDSSGEYPYDGMTPSGKNIDQILAISSHLSKSESYSWKREYEIEKLDDANVRMLRTDFAWSRIEPNNNDWHFAGYDAMVDLCLDDDIALDALLDYGVDWAMPGGSHDEISEADWGDYCGTVAAHYADRIDLYEIWNEQNTSRFWKPSPNPARYGDLLKAGYEAVHDNDPTASVLFGGLSPLDLHLFGPYGVWDYLVRVFEEHPDVCDYFDGMAIHPYTFIQQSSPEWVFRLGELEFPNLQGAIELVHELLDVIGCPEKPVYLSEIGWPHFFIGKDRQGAYLPRSLMIAASYGIEYFFWYTFWDSEPSLPLPTEDTFGFFEMPVDESTNPNPTYLALHALHELIGPLQYAGNLAEKLNWEFEHHAYVFANSAGDRIVGFWKSGAFNEEDNTDIPIPLDFSGTWVLYDQQGNQTDSDDASNSEIDVTIKGTVQYLVFKSGK